MWMMMGLGLGCSLPAAEVEGQHVRVAADPGLELCGGTLTHLDAFVVRMAEELGVEAPVGDDRVEFYWLEREEFVARSGCPDNAEGCVRRGVVYSKSMPLNHELVHALAGRWHTASFFVEGLAVAYQGLGAVSETMQWLTRPDVAQDLTVTTSQEVDYPTAGGFVVYLVELHGLAAVLRMMARLWHETSMAQIDAAFYAEFATSLTDSIAGFDEFVVECRAPQTSLLLECEAPEIGWDGLMFSEYRKFVCAQDDVVGPYDGDHIVVFRTIEIREAGLYEVSTIADSGWLVVALAECGPCGQQAVTRNNGVSAFELEAGLYSVRLLGLTLAASDPEVGWSIRRIDP